MQIFALVRALAPYVQPAHLRQSRGLGKLLMLLARSPSTRAEERSAAAELLASLLPSEVGSSVPLVDGETSEKRQRLSPGPSASLS